MGLSDCSAWGIGFVFHLFVFNKAKQSVTVATHSHQLKQQMVGKVLAQFWPPGAQGWAGNVCLVHPVLPSLLE